MWCQNYGGAEIMVVPFSVMWCRIYGGAVSFYMVPVKWRAIAIGGAEFMAVPLLSCFEAIGSGCRNGGTGNSLKLIGARHA
jgi:hypothetical protein